MDEGPVKAEWLPGTTQEGTGEEKLAAFKKQVMSFLYVWGQQRGRRDQARKLRPPWSTGRDVGLRMNQLSIWQLPIFEEERTNAGQRKGQNWMF